MLTKYSSVGIILVGLNDLDQATSYKICSEVVYLMESSTLMINKAVMLDNDCFMGEEISNIKTSPKNITNIVLYDFFSCNKIQKSFA